MATFFMGYVYVLDLVSSIAYYKSVHHVDNLHVDVLRRIKLTFVFGGCFYTGGGDDEVVFSYWMGSSIDFR